MAIVRMGKFLPEIADFCLPKVKLSSLEAVMRNTEAEFDRVKSMGIDVNEAGTRNRGAEFRPHEALLAPI